jgi:hypothetical protein
MVYLISQAPDAVLVYCQSLIIQDNSILNSKSAIYLKEALQGKEWIAQYMLGKCSLLNASMAVFRKSTFENVNKNFIYYKQCGDWKLWCDIAKQGSVLISGKYLNYFRHHSNNTTLTRWKEGYYFSEGSELFSYLINEHQLTDKEIYNGLLKFIRYFEYNKYLFTKEKSSKLLKQIKSIHPVIANKAHHTIRIQQNKERVKSILKRISL